MKLRLRSVSPFQRRKTATEMIDEVRGKEKAYFQSLTSAESVSTADRGGRSARSRSPFRRRKNAFELLDDVRDMELEHASSLARSNSLAIKLDSVENQRDPSSPHRHNNNSPSGSDSSGSRSKSSPPERMAPSLFSAAIEWFNPSSSAPVLDDSFDTAPTTVEEHTSFSASPEFEARMTQLQPESEPRIPLTIAASKSFSSSRSGSRSPFARRKKASDLVFEVKQREQEFEVGLQQQQPRADLREPTTLAAVASLEERPETKVALKRSRSPFRRYKRASDLIAEIKQQKREYEIDIKSHQREQTSATVAAERCESETERVAPCPDASMLPEQPGPSIALTRSGSPFCRHRKPSDLVAKIHKKGEIVEASNTASPSANPATGFFVALTSSRSFNSRSRSRSRSPFPRRKEASDMVAEIDKKGKYFEASLPSPCASPESSAFIPIASPTCSFGSRSGSRSPFRRRKKADELVAEIGQKGTEFETNTIVSTIASPESEAPIAQTSPRSFSSRIRTRSRSPFRKRLGAKDIISEIAQREKEFASNAKLQSEKEESQAHHKDTCDVQSPVRKVEVGYAPRSSMGADESSVVEVQLDHRTKKRLPWKTPQRNNLTWTTTAHQEIPVSASLPSSPELEKRRSFRERIVSQKNAIKASASEITRDHDKNVVGKHTNSGGKETQKRALTPLRSVALALVKRRSKLADFAFPRLQRNRSQGEDSLTDVKIALSSVQKELDVARKSGKSGKRASRDLVMKTLLKVADTLESKEDREELRYALKRADRGAGRSISSSDASDDSEIKTRSEEFSAYDDFFDSDSCSSSAYSGWSGYESQKGMLDLFGLPSFWSGEGSSGVELPDETSDTASSSAGDEISKPPNVQRATDDRYTVSRMMEAARQRKMDEDAARKEVLAKEADRRLELENEAARRRELEEKNRRAREIAEEEEMMRELERVDRKIIQEAEAAKRRLRKQMEDRNKREEMEQERIAIEVLQPPKRGAPPATRTTVRGVLDKAAQVKRRIEARQRLVDVVVQGAGSSDAGKKGLKRADSFQSESSDSQSRTTASDDDHSLLADSDINVFSDLLSLSQADEPVPGSIDQSETDTSIFTTDTNAGTGPLMPPKNSKLAAHLLRESSPNSRQLAHHDADKKATEDLSAHDAAAARRVSILDDCSLSLGSIDTAMFTRTKKRSLRCNPQPTQASLGTGGGRLSRAQDAGDRPLEEEMGMEEEHGMTYTQKMVRRKQLGRDRVGSILTKAHDDPMMRNKGGLRQLV